MIGSPALTVWVLGALTTYSAGQLMVILLAVVTVAMLLTMPQVAYMVGELTWTVIDWPAPSSA